MNNLSVLDQIRDMHLKMKAHEKIIDEASAYSMVDQGDDWDAVRKFLRSGHEVSHIVMSHDIYEKLSKDFMTKAMTGQIKNKNADFFYGLPVAVEADLAAGTLRVMFRKSTPRDQEWRPSMDNTREHTPSYDINSDYTPDYRTNTDYTPTAHSLISMCDMPCI